MTKPKTPKNPRGVTSSARSTDKARARRPRTAPYAAEQRAKALESVRGSGIASAAREHGISKATLVRWSKAAGIDVGEEARARTAQATEAVKARAAVARLTTVELLEKHIEMAGAYLALVAEVNTNAAEAILVADLADLERKVGMAGPYVDLKEGTPAEEAARRAKALDTLPLSVRDAEGVLTRAIHDLQLLRGEATERGTIEVTFDVPRPAAPEAVVDLPPEGKP